MTVTEIRSRVLERLASVVGSGDLEAVADAFFQARILMTALAEAAPSAEIDLESIKVDVKTAAQILQMHPEYVRQLARKGKLESSKENGEVRVNLSALANLNQFPSAYAESPVGHLVDPYSSVGSFWVLKPRASG